MVDNIRFPIASKILVMIMIDAGTAEYPSLHLIYCPMKRRGRAMEGEKDAWSVLRHLLL